jgi:predicted transcriptional regulator
MGVSQSYVNKLERAIADPRLSTVLRYATVVLGTGGVALLLREITRGESGPPA